MHIARMNARSNMMKQVTQNKMDRMLELIKGMNSYPVDKQKYKDLNWCLTSDLSNLAGFESPIEEGMFLRSRQVGGIPRCKEYDIFPGFESHETSYCTLSGGVVSRVLEVRPVPVWKKELGGLGTGLAVKVKITMEADQIANIRKEQAIQLIRDELSVWLVISRNAAAMVEIDQSVPLQEVELDPT